MATFGTGPLAPFLKYSLPSFQRFAKLHGYTMVVDPPANVGEVPAWRKLSLLRELLETYELVVWIDADTYIVNPADDFPELGDNVHAFAYPEQAVFGRFIPNTGVWVVNRGMRKWLALAEKMTAYQKHAWWEQAAIIALLGYDLPVDSGRIEEATKYPSELEDKSLILPLDFNTMARREEARESTRIYHALGPGKNVQGLQRIVRYHNERFGVH